MSHIDPLDPQQASGETADIFREMATAFGKVPNLFRTAAHHPPLLRANWNMVKAMMMEGGLSRKVKETIAVLVSKDNGCDYCVGAHNAALSSIGPQGEPDSPADWRRTVPGIEVHLIQCPYCIDGCTADSASPEEARYRPGGAESK